MSGLLELSASATSATSAASATSTTSHTSATSATATTDHTADPTALTATAANSFKRDKAPNAISYAVDVSEITVAWGTKRGDGAIRLQFPRVPLDGGEIQDLPVCPPPK